MWGHCLLQGSQVKSLGRWGSWEQQDVHVRLLLPHVQGLVLVPKLERGQESSSHAGFILLLVRRTGLHWASLHSELSVLKI